MDKSGSIVSHLLGKVLKRPRAAPVDAGLSPLAMLERLHAGEQADYCLYIRPPGGQAVADAGLLTVDLELLLLQALDPLPAVVLDESGAGPSSARLPDEAFVTLADVARILCLAPCAGERFQERLRLLKQKGMLGRCVWIMPDAGTLGLADWSAPWAAARSSAASLGIELSPYTPGGWLFRLDASGNACTFRPIVNPNARKIAAALEAICAQM